MSELLDEEKDYLYDIFLSDFEREERYKEYECANNPSEWVIIIGAWIRDRLIADGYLKEEDKKYKGMELFVYRNDELWSVFNKEMIGDTYK